MIKVLKNMMNNNRDLIFLKNTFLNYIFQFIGIFIGFFTIPISLSFLGEERFAIWQTLLSMITWASLANFGIGNGLRNVITKLYANKKMDKIQSNISAAYFFVFKVSIIIFISLNIIVLLINPEKIFKDTAISDIEIKISFLIIALNFCINFVLGIVTSVAYGIHKSYYITIQQTLISLVTFLGILIINKIFESNIIYIACIYTVINVISNIILSKIIYTKNRLFIPTLNYKKENVSNEMYALGIQFFIIQIGSLILASTDNFLVSSLIASKEVTVYSIVSKLFLTVNNIFGILLIPLWNSTTDALENNEIDWIKNVIKRLLLLLLIVCIILFICVYNFDLITYIWLGKIFNIQKSLLVYFAIYVILLCFNLIFMTVQNGIGQLKYQILGMGVAATINIPLAFMFVKYLHLGLKGVVLANISSQIILTIICPLNVIIYFKKFKKGVNKIESCH